MHLEAMVFRILYAIHYDHRFKLLVHPADIFETRGRLRIFRSTADSNFIIYI